MGVLNTKKGHPNGRPFFDECVQCGRQALAVSLLRSTTVGVAMKMEL